MPPVLLRAPRHPRRTPRSRSGLQQAAAGCPGQAPSACLISCRKTARSRESDKRLSSAGRQAA
eukprot:6822883-Alexandrium_andersonii.AAC.1